jgi:ABC-type nitrate/sulfonate/bicarbonate transport system substrate-binding protein
MAMKKSVLLGMAAALALAAQDASALDKISYGTAVKLSPVYYLPVLAGQQQGIFKKHDLDVEWVPSNSGPDFHRALAAGAVQIGSSNSATDIPAIGRGAPSIIVANLQTADNFGIWVSTKGHINTIEDLKGAKIGVSRLAGAEDSYGKLVATKAGIEGMQYTATGGVEASMALLVTGGIDGVVLTPHQMIDLKLQSKAKEIVSVEKYKPQPWISYTIVAAKDFVAKQPAVAKRVIQSILEANAYITSPAGKSWAMATMKEQSHFSDEALPAVYDETTLSTDGKIERAGVKNVVDFMVQYDLIKASDVANVDALFTDQFVK